MSGLALSVTPSAVTELRGSGQVGRKGGYGPTVKSTFEKDRGMPSEAVLCARSPPQRTRAIPTQSARADAGQVMVGHRGRAGAAAAIKAVRLSQLGSSAKRWFVATG